MRILPALLCLALCSCTSLDVNAGKYYTNADNATVTIKATNGHITFYSATANNHSPVIRSYGSVLGTGLMGAAGLGLGMKIPTIVK